MSYDWYTHEGRNLFNKYEKKFNAKLEEFTINGRIDGSKLQENWFPEIEADIFLSHSHQDEDLAITLAGYLHYHYGLTIFIDSCFWGYSNNLLRAIDNKYSKSPTGDSYNYDKRNYSTSHVHMMLSSALQKMIDNTECLIFLNTENSLSSLTDDIEDKTMSPWIYMELIASKITRRTRKREIYLYEEKSLPQVFSYEESKILQVEYKVDITHLLPLNPSTLLNLKEISHICSLDRLYSQTVSPMDFSHIYSESKLIK